MEQVAWLIVALLVVFGVSGLVLGWEVKHQVGPIIGATIGMWPALYSLLPARTVITWNVDGMAISTKVDGILANSGWRFERAAWGVRHYVQRLPRWARWDVGNVVIEVAEQRLTVRGPIMIIKRISKEMNAASSGLSH